MLDAGPEGMEPGGGDGPEDKIVLVTVNENHYLLEGEEHLNQLLLVDGTFPTPIRCMTFTDLFEARRILGDDINIPALWGIHPEIIARLRREGRILDIDPPQP
jgi:hypothetical protein